MPLGTDFVTISPEHVIESGPANIHPLLTRKMGNPPFGIGLTEHKPGVLDLDLDYDEAVYLIEGDLTIRSEGVDHKLQPGQLIWMPRGRKIQYLVERSCKYVYVVSPPSPNT